MKWFLMFLCLTLYNVLFDYLFGEIGMNTLQYEGGILSGLVGGWMITKY